MSAVVIGKWSIGDVPPVTDSQVLLEDGTALLLEDTTALLLEA